MISVVLIIQVYSLCKTFASSERRRGWRPKGLAQLDEHCDLLQLVEP